MIFIGVAVGVTLIFIIAIVASLNFAYTDGETDGFLGRESRVVDSETFLDSLYLRGYGAGKRRAAEVRARRRIQDET